MKNKKLLLLALSLSPGTVFAGAISKANTFSAGQVASSAAVNTNFDQLFTEVNAKESRITTLESAAWTKNGTALTYPSGFVGVRVASPSTALDVNGQIFADTSATNNFVLNSSGANLGFISNNSTGVWSLGFGTTIGTLGTPVLAWTSGGKVGIGTTTPGAPLEVNGAILATAFNVVSDARLKRDVQPLDDSELDKILRLQGVHYYWRDQSRGTSRQIGLLAQEVRAVYPEVVATAGNGFLSVGYSQLVAPLIEAVKALYAKITSVETRQGEDVRRLTKENQELRAYLCAKDASAPFCSK